MSIPRRTPAGVVTANRHASVGLSILKCLNSRSGGREAILMPKESPSKSWWNITAIKRVAVQPSFWQMNNKRIDNDALKSGPDVIDKVIPMTNEWIMMPSCNTLTGMSDEQVYKSI